MIEMLRVTQPGDINAVAILAREIWEEHYVPIVGFVEERCSERSIRELWLNVNRHNAGAIAFYQNMGFTRSGSIVQQIGNGFVMDDDKMVKPINIPAPVAQVERQ